MDYPVESFSKVFIAGNSEADKTSLAAMIKEGSSMSSESYFIPDNEVFLNSNLSSCLLQTGIVPMVIKRRECGKLFLYDFA